MPSTRLLPASTITSRRTPETQVKAQLIWLRYHSKVIQCCKKPMEGSGQQLNSTQNGKPPKCGNFWWKSKDHEKLMESSYFACFTVIKFNGQEDTGKKKNHYISPIKVDRKCINSKMEINNDNCWRISNHEIIKFHSTQWTMDTTRCWNCKFWQTYWQVYSL